MEQFDMSDIIYLLGFSPPPNGQSSYYVHCPCCDETPRKRHLNINLKKNVFRCPRCGVSGGMFDLYSLVTGIPRKDAREAIAARLGVPENRAEAHRSKTELLDVQEYPITDLETRNATYSALLSKLELASDHRESLLARGLTEDEIERLGYKTMPVIGNTALAKQLQSEGAYLSGVPGFFRTKEDAWTFDHDQRGILIPVRSVDGQIQGLQLRRDNVKKRKFRWISSADRKDGCRAESWTHLTGPAARTIILTEGPMKADVIHALTGETVLAVPGVNALGQLRKALEQIRTSGTEEIKTAFDMDFAANCHVQNGYVHLMKLIDSMGFRFGTYLWDPRYKGLDDYIWEYCLDKHRS